MLQYYDCWRKGGYATGKIASNLVIFDCASDPRYKRKKLKQQRHGFKDDCLSA